MASVRDVQRMVFDAIRELNGVDYQTLINRDLAAAIEAHDRAERLVRSRCVTPEMRVAWAEYRDDRSSQIAKSSRRAANGNASPRVVIDGVSVPKTLDGRGARRRRQASLSPEG